MAKNSSPLSSEDESDVESLHSFHYSPKAVDMPSAIRLAKRLYGLDGFKKSDVSRHLSKKLGTLTRIVDRILLLTKLRFILLSFSVMTLAGLWRRSI